MRNTNMIDGHNCQTLKIKLVKKTSGTKYPTIKDSSDVIKIMKKEVEGLDRECFWALPLDNKNRVIGINLVSMGSLNTTITHPREIFKLCLLTNATSVILAHNHPSGDSTPSNEDFTITQRLQEAGEILSIKLLDHVVIGENNHYSFANESLLNTFNRRGSR